MATFKDLEDLMKRLLALDPPGVAISVARHGGVLYEGYFGTMDLAGTRPIAPDTLYRLYSMTKPIAALCGMLQYERGVFLMDDPVSEYLPEYKRMKIRVKKDDSHCHEARPRRAGRQQILR